VITASEPSWIAPFTGLSPRQFRQLKAVLRREGADTVRRGQPWGLPLEDRLLLVAAPRGLMRFGVLRGVESWPAPPGSVFGAALGLAAEPLKLPSYRT
jgi:hypothetical protein